MQVFQSRAAGPGGRMGNTATNHREYELSL
jgi:hypothetical protein